MHQAQVAVEFVKINVVAERGKESFGNSRKQLDLQYRFNLKHALEDRVCSRGMAEAMRGNEDADRRPGADTCRIQSGIRDVSATEVLIQEGLEVLLVVFLHLLCPLQR